ncbi:hypothetical protein E2C01_056725 [Portunus trituberculatus]|uniref:Uncharacterized protein n=1 Tax=Portunus trituberculatus TaxID=210409 RepID=A0A5B7GYI5_PORTR|nr:hypothetical protein [Portunus trituberculatus]
MQRIRLVLQDLPYLCSLL